MRLAQFIFSAALMAAVGSALPVDPANPAKPADPVPLTTTDPAQPADPAPAADPAVVAAPDAAQPVDSAQPADAVPATAPDAAAPDAADGPDLLALAAAHPEGINLQSLAGNQTERGGDFEAEGFKGHKGGKGKGGGAADCADINVIFARGTTEPGTEGIVVGPPFKDALTAQAAGKSVKMAGVPYPADIPGYLSGGSKEGSAMMAKMVTDTVAACPNSKVVMSGYSQGGQLVHNAAEQLNAATAGRVSSAVIFGDPFSHKPVANIDPSKVLVICHPGDNICDNGILILPAHLTYGADSAQAAQFVTSKAR